MNIVTEKAFKDRLSDGIDTIINLNEADFNKFIEMLTIEPNKETENWIDFFYSTDRSKQPEKAIKLGLFQKNERKYIGGAVYSITDFISQLESYINNFNQDSNEYLRCSEIISTRSIEALKKYFSGRNGEDYELVDRLFEVLTSPDICQKFMDFDEHKDFFKINNKEYQIEDYLKKFGEIFKYRDELEGEEHAFFVGDFLIRQFNLPEDLKTIMYQNATQIYQTYHERYTRYVDRRYEFRALDNEEDMRVFRNGDEPDWNVNEALRASIFNDMPQGLSLEEQALFIYTRLCQELEYNEEYLYRDKGISSQFESDFSQQQLESIKPGSKITCFDFSRIFSKLVNELKGDIEAVVISQGTNRGHFLTGFYTDKVSVRLEAIRINLNGKKDPTNDLMKAKNGIKLRGIQPIFDKDKIVKDSLNKVYSLVYGKDTLSIKSFVQELKDIPETDVPNDINLKLQSFLEVMRDKGIVGNEFVQTLDGMCMAKFFGKDVEKAYLGKRIEHDGKKHIQRMVLFRQKEKEEQEEPHLYLIDTSTLEMVEPTPQQLIEKLTSGSIIYESEKHKIAGIDKEAKDDTTK